MGPREDESPTVLALPGVVDHDWQALVARGRTQGLFTPKMSRMSFEMSNSPRCAHFGE